VTRSEVRDLFSRNKKAREIDRALTVLEEAGRLTRTSHSDGRGRPAEIWRPQAA
jgi:predicted ArsR family transcriptional regulator